MKPSQIISLIALLLSCFTAQAKFEAKVWLPTWNGGMNVNRVSFTNPEIEVIPRGIYAEITLTFEINAPYNAYASTDSLETVIDFDLPANSFVHDSWLWLDETHIIRAEVVEKLKAQQIYNNLVTKIRTDPSILTKNGASNYNLRVWPLKIDYPRKVRIVYSAPFEWNRNNFSVPLPIELFKLSKILPDLKVTVHHEDNYDAPAFMEADYQSMLSTGGTATDYVTIPATTYGSMHELNLIYTTKKQGMFFTLHETAQNEGIYQLAVNMHQLLGSNYKPKNVVFVIDQNGAGADMLNTTAVLSHVRSFLRKHYNDNDSFKLLYASSNGTGSISAGWLPTTESNISTYISNITIQSADKNFGNLVKDAIAACADKSAAQGQIVVISANASYADNTSVNALIKSIKDDWGGTVPNKIHVINNCTTMSGNGSGLGSELLFTNLCAISGGRYSEVEQWVSSTYSYSRYLDMARRLSETVRDNGEQTKVYDVEIPLSGFTYARYDIAGTAKLNMSVTYFETGKYYGTVNYTGDINIDYITGGVQKNIVHNITNQVHFGPEHYIKSWVNKYMIDLIGQNDPYYTKEIVDSSKNNRVLCDSTAFLALDNGDTIKIDGKDNTVPLSTQEIKTSKVKLYPNPFTSQLTIELEQDADEVVIYDVVGRVVFSIKPEKGTKTITWNGKDTGGNTMPAGMYVICITTNGVRTMHKVMKQ